MWFLFSASRCIHCESKQQDSKLLPITHQILTDFQTFFTDGLGSKFAIKFYLNIPLRPKHYLVKYECHKMASI